jgi:DnaJ domain
MSIAVKDSYEVLGVDPFASMDEVKAAYRDLAKVWHPDRFSHDPRLQEKAQDKLKEINEAFELIKSGKARRRSARESGNVTVQPEQRNRHRLWVPPAVCCVAVFLGVIVLLAWPQDQPEARPAASTETSGSPVEQAPASPPKNEKTIYTERWSRDDKNGVAENDGAANVLAPQVSPRALQPLPTVSVIIDPSTGLLATDVCSSKVRMTYADGSTPTQYCTAHKTSTAKTGETTESKSGLKSFAKRVVSPGKWFDKSKEANDADPKP